MYRHASVDQIAHATSRGWKNSLINLAASELRPKASVWVRYWEMFPGNTAMKNNAVIRPIWAWNLEIEAMARPSEISTIPDATTTKSASKGSQSGTWAWKDARAKVRCPIPAKSRPAPSSNRARTLTIFIPVPRTRVRRNSHRGRCSISRQSNRWQVCGHRVVASQKRSRCQPSRLP